MILFDHQESRLNLKLKRIWNYIFTKFICCSTFTFSL